MKRYINKNSSNQIIDIFTENLYEQRKDVSTELFDEVESPADVWINGKCIFDEAGNPIYQYINKKIIEKPNVDALSAYIAKQKTDECFSLRKHAYTTESDGLFFDYQRGEIEKSIWENKVKEIKARYPKPAK